MPRLAEGRVTTARPGSMTPPRTLSDTEGAAEAGSEGDGGDHIERFFLGRMLLVRGDMR